MSEESFAKAFRNHYPLMNFLVLHFIFVAFHVIFELTVQFSYPFLKAYRDFLKDSILFLFAYPVAFCTYAIFVVRSDFFKWLVDERPGTFYDAFFACIMTLFMVDLFLWPTEVYRQTQKWTCFQYFLEFLGIIHHIACIIGGYVWRYDLYDPSKPGPHHLFILTCVIVEIGSALIRWFIISGKRRVFLVIASLTHVCGATFLIIYGFRPNLMSTGWGIAGITGLLLRQIVVCFLFSDRFRPPLPIPVSDSPDHYVVETEIEMKTKIANPDDL